MSFFDDVISMPGRGINKLPSISDQVAKLLSRSPSTTLPASVYNMIRAKTNQPNQPAQDVSSFNSLPEFGSRFGQGGVSSSLDALTSNGSPGLPGDVKRSGRGLSSIPTSIAPSSPSAYDVYAKMVADFNPQKMASEQYTPQYAMLDRLNQDAQSRYNTNNAQIGDMYTALQNSIKGDATGIKGSYGQAGKDIATNYAANQKQLNDSSSKSKADTGAMLKLLGIQAAAPDVLGKLDTSNAQWNNLMASSNQRANTSNTENQQAALDYNTTMGQRAGFEGKAQQTGLMGQLNDILNQNAVKRMGVQSEQSRSGSEYQMALMNMQKGLADSEAAGIGNLAKAQADQASAALDASKFDLENRKFNETRDQNAFNNMSPYERLAASSAGYKDDQGTPLWADRAKQSDMAALITDQWTGASEDPNTKGNWNNPDASPGVNGQEFIRQILNENPNMSGAEQRAIAAMASQFFNSQTRK